MKITAATQDQIILIDGIPALMAEMGGYNMQRGEWAVHFDTDLGVGHIEYLDNRGNQILTRDLFERAYAWLIDEHTRYVTAMAEQEAAEEAARNEQQQDPIDTEFDSIGDGNHD
ncbi:hypothetical protein, partial [Photobacterium sp. 1_MG-2023]|uniref:hypothetical protein n=1 Tax=Photobacterium sp. 1_MG-2023 TaxID=3062646 RepID=UPI0026E1B830